MLGFQDSDDAQQPAAKQRKINEKDSVPVITDADKKLADRVRKQKKTDQAVKATLQKAAKGLPSVKSFFAALPANPDDRSTKQSAVPVGCGSGSLDVADGSFAAAPSLSLRDIVDAGSAASASPAAFDSGDDLLNAAMFAGRRRLSGRRGCSRVVFTKGSSANHCQYPSVQRSPPRDSRCCASARQIDFSDFRDIVFV